MEENKVLQQYLVIRNQILDLSIYYMYKRPLKRKLEPEPCSLNADVMKTRRKSNDGPTNI